WYQELKFLIKMPPRRNKNIDDVYKQEFEWHNMARIEEQLHQFVDQLADQMNDMMNPRRCGDQLEDDGVVNDDYEEAPVIDDDQFDDDYEGPLVALHSKIPLVMFPLLEDFFDVFPDELHGEGHVGRDPTLELVQDSYFWPTMRKEVDCYVKRCLVGDHVKAWDQKLCQVEFAHNHAVNQSIGFSPLQVYYAQPRGPLHLMPLYVFGFVPKEAHDFVKGLPYHSYSSDDDLVGNSRTNFVYPWGNDACLSVEEQALLFLEAQDSVKNKPLFQVS
ncbi:putative reverse transcriptase domain-containing protein, partial [Tanacetum coccineum]